MKLISNLPASVKALPSRQVRYLQIDSNYFFIELLKMISLQSGLISPNGIEQDIKITGNTNAIGILRVACKHIR